MYESIKGWDSLILKREKTFLFILLILNLREAVDDIKFIGNSDILFQFLNQKIMLHFPKYETIIDLRVFRGFIFTYLNLRSRDIMHKLTPKEISNIAFRNKSIPQKLSIEDLEGWSWEIKDANLSPWESTAIINLVSLFSKVSIINSQINIVRNLDFMTFLNFDRARTSQLFIDQCSFSMKEFSEVTNSEASLGHKFILNEYGWNYNSYWLFFILKQCKLLEKNNSLGHSLL